MDILDDADDTVADKLVLLLVRGQLGGPALRAEDELGVTMEVDGADDTLLFAKELLEGLNLWL